MVRHHVRVVGALISLCILYAAHGAWAGPPTDQLRDGVDRVIQILRDPGLKGETQIDERRAAIAVVAGEIFDFGEMAKRSLAQHWDKRTPAEQREFVRLFTVLIQRSYLSQIEQHAATALMTYRGETVENDYAVVQTTVPLNNGNAMPLDYRMRNTRDHWQVYDFSMGGISLVANYRAQFNKIIRTSSYENLVEKLKAHETQSSAPSAAPAGMMVAR